MTLVGQTVRGPSEARFSGTGQRCYWIVTLVAPVLFYLGGVAYAFPFTIDDSYISMRFASNLIAGHGLAFNPGAEPVEGYTNFLLVLIEAGFIRAGMTTLLPIKMLMTAVGIGLVATVAVYGRLRLGHTQSPLRWLTAVAAILVATSSPVVLWTASAMETVLFCCLVTAASAGYSLFLVGRLSRSRLLLVELAWILAILTRPEGLLFWILTVAHTAILGTIRRYRPLIKKRLPGIAVGLICLSSYGIWKLWYFDHLLPLTYLAKAKPWEVITFLGGGARFISFLSINGNFVLALAILVGTVFALRQQMRIDCPLLYLLALAAGYVTYLLSLGFQTAMDDAFRFYVPMVPLMSLILIEVGRTLRKTVRLRPMFYAGLVALMILVPVRARDLWQAWQVDLNWGILHYRIPARSVAEGLEQGHVALGKWLRSNAPPDSKIVLYDAGAIPYFSGLETIDTWSLSDPQLVDYRRAITTAATQQEQIQILLKMREYVLSRDPAYIVQDNLGLLEMPRVRERYRSTGATFIYLNWYMCGYQQACRYLLEPHVDQELQVEDIR